MRHPLATSDINDRPLDPIFDESVPVPRKLHRLQKYRVHILETGTDGTEESRGAGSVIVTIMERNKTIKYYVAMMV